MIGFIKFWIVRLTESQSQVVHAKPYSTIEYLKLSGYVPDFNYLKSSTKKRKKTNANL